MCIQNFLHICLHLHIVYLCDPVWMKVLAPHVGFDVSWGQLSHHRRKWQRFHEGCQTVAGGTRGSLTLQDPQDAKDSVILSMFESRSTGLAKRLLAFQQHIAVEVCDSLTAGIPCAPTTLVISLSIWCGIFGISRFPDFLNFRASDGVANTQKLPAWIVLRWHRRVSPWLTTTLNQTQWILGDHIGMDSGVLQWNHMASFSNRPPSRVQEGSDSLPSMLWKRLVYRLAATMGRQE